MPSPRGIFRLKQVYEEQLSGNWSVKSDVWLAPSPYYGPTPDVGYFGSGGARTQSLVISSQSGTARFVDTIHLSEKAKTIQLK